MKTNTLKSAFALLALCSVASQLPAAGPVVPPRSPAGVALVSVQPNPLRDETIVVGTSRPAVKQQLGPADTVLADGSWLYARYRGESTEHAFSESGTLVVHFVGETVSALTLANGAEVRALRAMPTPRDDSRLPAATPQR